MSACLAPLFDAPRPTRFRSPVPSADSNRVVIVDDDPLVLSLLGKVTRRMGFDALPVNSLDAVDGGAVSDAALLLLDLHVGGDHALSLVRRLAQAQLEIPVVLMSGFGNRVLNAVREACEQQRCTVAGILSKPFEMSALESILAHFRRRRASPHMGGLGEAIGDGSVVPFYQPMVDMRTGRVTGAEALVRWLHPEQGIMVPSDILPEAEARGLMPALTWRVLDQALSDWSALADGCSSFDLSVNVSAEMLVRPEFVSTVTDLLSLHGVPARRLTIEITEAAAALDVPQVCTALCRLRSAGINLALDDFGSGCSSLTALRDLPFNRIKLDRSFVTHAETRPEERMIIASVTRLAADFGLESTAEGIETDGCFELVRDFGMNYGQGYLMSEPVPCSQFRERTLLRR